MFESVASAALDGQTGKIPMSTTANAKLARLYFPHLVHFSEKYDVPLATLADRWNKLNEKLEKSEPKDSNLRRFIRASLILHSELS